MPQSPSGRRCLRRREPITPPHIRTMPSGVNTMIRASEHVSYDAGTIRWAKHLSAN